MPKPKVKILLIEDDQALVEMYQLKFQEEGWEVLVSDKGAEGLKLAKEVRPNIILLDIILPEIDGFAILQDLKDDPKTKKIPIILLSNLGQESDVTKGKKLGAVDYLIKADYTPTQVIEKIKKHLK